MRVENIDVANNQIHYMNTKNKTHRSAYIEPVLMNLIQTYLVENNIVSGYIFMNNKTGKLHYVRGILMGIIKQIGLDDFHIHDERHTFASYMAMSGSGLTEIAEALGHSSLSVAKRYTHLTKKHLDTRVKCAVQMMSIDF